MEGGDTEGESSRGANYVCVAAVFTVSHYELRCILRTILRSAVPGTRGKLLQDLHINFLMPEM